ncbi:efflux RND transporter permease subunit [Novosphingobium sp. Chol11]|uniref:efflux RND transporter permease subunit n=1 Tax=Novosphingobium sp. Chol11 TaxID=1385763 RepID=UPI0025D3FE66|nr:efflux RND transporter permease subunit [Novosphingobium sp. Chol11]
MTALIRFAVLRWQFMALALVLLVAIGLITAASLPRTEDPPLNSPGFNVVVVLPGATPQTIEQQVTKPIEVALAGLDNLRELKSKSGDGVATIEAEYIWGTSPDRKYDEVVREVNALRPTLPAGVIRLDVIRNRPTSMPIIQIALVSEILPMRAFEKVARDLKNRLARIPGIRKAEVLGAPKSEVRVSLDMARLAAQGINPGTIVEALRAGGAETPIGSVNAGDRRLNMRFAGAYPDIAAIRAIPVLAGDGRGVSVGDLADVEWADREPTHIIHFNGKRALLVTAEQGDRQDIGRLTKAIETETEAFKRLLPGSVRLERGFVQNDNVTARLDHLTRDLLLALAIVALTLLPLGWRAAAVVMIAIPVSLLFGVLTLAAFDLTLNQLAVAGFVLALGLLVDDAIVVIENVSRWLREGADRTTAAIGATTQIALPVLGCTACLMFAFLPLIALPEASGEFIRSLPISVLGTVGGSLIVALTVIPFIAARVLKPDEDPHGNRMMRALTSGIERVYAPVLHRSLDRPWAALGAIFLLASLSLPLVVVIGSSLFPPADLPQFVVQVEMPRGTALKATEEMVARVEKRLHRESAINWTVANAGRGSPALYYNARRMAEDPAAGEVGVGLKGFHGEETRALIDRLRGEFARIPGAKVTLKTFTQGPQIEAPVALRFVGPDLATLTRLAAKAEAVMEAEPGLRDVGNPLRITRTDLTLQVDEARVRALGVPSGALRTALQMALGGATPAILRDRDDDEYPLSVRLPMQGRNEIAALDRIFVTTFGGGSVPLSALATVSAQSGPAEIDRFQRERSVTLTADVKQGTLVSRAADEALASIEAQVPLPPGYAIKVGGEAESKSRSFGGLLPAIIVASVGILGVLVLEFGKFRQVAVVAGVVPLGFFGAVVALWLTGNNLSFTAIVGLIALVGIEIKNSLLLVDFTEQLRREGMPVRAAVERAGEMRFLPVLLTSITAIGGLLPLAFEENGLYSPMAIAMIGGLATSTILARIATPVMYLLIVSPRSERARPAPPLNLAGAPA